MLKKLSIKLAIIALMFTASGCNKWLALEPLDGITGAEFWKTKEQVGAAVTGCYSALLGSPTGARSLSESLFLWGELRADMILSTANTTADEIAVMNVNILDRNTIADWKNVYQIINYCNTVIDNAPGVLQKDATFTQAALNTYISEAKALRAFLYFTLAKTFGEVPLKLKSTSTDKEIVNIAKTSQDSVLAQVVKDLNEAEANAVLTYGSQAMDKGRITKYTINAMQADVYLWMNNYNACIEACNKIINSNKFGLIDGVSSSTWFSTLYANGNSNESIFEFQFDNQKLNTFHAMFLTRRRFQAAPLVMDEVYTLDFIDPLNKDIRADGGSVRSTDQTIWKYIGLNNTQARAVDQSFAHWFVYRYADILLMKAEASNELGQGQTALDLIYAVRNRARALNNTNNNPGANDKDGIATFILQERAREFSFEGKRWFDILRFAKRNNYQKLNLLLDMVAGTVPPDRQQSAINKFKDKNSHYLPIFYTDLEANKLLVQNPFYK
jgi:starch-binding outer membrane protein, SusD/RagB family